MAMRLPRRHGPAAAAAVLAVIVAVIAAMAWPDGGQRRRGVTVSEIAAAPELYAGREVLVEGRLARRPAKIPLSDRGAFVLRGAAGEILYVVPRVPVADPVDIGRTVRVEGTVRAPGPAADEIEETPPVTRVDVVTRLGAAAVLEADTVEPR